MKYLLDTCAISEPRKPSPNQGFIEWLEDQIEDRLYLSALTIGEIRRGIYRLEPSRRRTELEEWLELLRKRFSGRVLPITETTFLFWGKMYGEFERTGVVRPAFDSLLEALALEHDLVIVTRNVRNFEKSNAGVLNPWVS
ncbi:MAG: type II toxin-antitoxin system VapC family toxin [Acidobacteria bacterium]|nr:type II toxin-antitoxin system VapC family toxin [Acidobacteriota bacterium]MBK8812804.1 type II toxin-antitoxin system VapC family toxin [Acidobacteriota bacterium]